MSYSPEEQKYISQLSQMINELIYTLNELGEDTEEYYKATKKVKNILSAKDPKGMKNVKRYLMMDFRMIDDNQIDEDTLNTIIDKIYAHIKSNNIFTP